MGSSSVLVQILVVTPICQWLLTSGRFARPKNLIIAIAFLCAVAAASEGQEWMNRPASLYSVLDVSRSATPAELKSAFRKQSLQWHPDKNSAPEAQQRFAAMQEAYDTLSDPESRRIYERYGTSSKNLRERQQQAQRSEQDVLMGVAIHYVIWAVLSYLMTIGRASADARQWSFIGLVVCLFVECQMLFGGLDPLSSVLPRLPQFDKIALIHMLYPPFMHGCRLLGQFLFVDTEQQHTQLMVAVLETNKEILVSLEQLIQSAALSGKKGGSGGAAGLAANVQVQAAAGPTSGDALRGDEMLPLAARMKRRQEAEQRAQQAAQQAKAKTGGIPTWLIISGLMFLFNYLSR